MMPARPARVCFVRPGAGRNGDVMIEQCADCRAETAASTTIITAVDRHESDNLDDPDKHRIQQN
jgi:hypothetical protein